MTAPAGLFLSLDGIDGTGKSTQCRLLAEWLRGRGREVVECVDPGGTAVGQELRQLLLASRHQIAAECEALLFMSSRSQLVAEVIRPALEAGKIVVSDRYLLATVVYQGHGGRLDPTMLWTVGTLATGGLQPHLTLVLDLPLEEAIQRRSRPNDRIESKPLDYHRRVREGFLVEASRHQDRIRVVDARPAVEVVQAEIRRLVTPLVS